MTDNNLMKEQNVEKNEFEQSNTEVVAKNCVQCGASLTQEEIFCPHCGQNNDFQIAGDVSDVIAQFNQGIEEQAAKKKKKKKTFVRVLLVMGLVVSAMIATYVYFDGCTKNIIEEINSFSPITSIIKTQYQELTPIGQFLFRGKIIEAFEEKVSANEYVSASGWLVNESAIREYKQFKEIASALKITRSDKDTNVMKHIKKVLKLEKYAKYNDVRKCALESISDYSDYIDYVNDANDASGYYLIKLYIGYAENSISSAESTARTYSSGDALCKKYVNALGIIEQEMSELYYGYGYYSSSTVSSAMKTVSQIFSDISDAEGKVKKIVDSIPSIN